MGRKIKLLLFFCFCLLFAFAGCNNGSENSPSSGGSGGSGGETGGETGLPTLDYHGVTDPADLRAKIDFEDDSYRLFYEFSYFEFFPVISGFFSITQAEWTNVPPLAGRAATNIDSPPAQPITLIDGMNRTIPELIAQKGASELVSGEYTFDDWDDGDETGFGKAVITVDGDAGLFEGYIKLTNYKTSCLTLDGILWLSGTVSEAGEITGMEIDFMDFPLGSSLTLNGVMRIQPATDPEYKYELTYHTLITYLDDELAHTPPQNALYIMSENIRMQIKTTPDPGTVLFKISPKGKFYISPSGYVEIESLQDVAMNLAGSIFGDPERRGEIKFTGTKHEGEDNPDAIYMHPNGLAGVTDKFYIKFDQGDDGVIDWTNIP